MNRVCNLLGIKYPIVQTVMVWYSGLDLASAVSDDGSLSILRSGSIYPDVLIHHIHQTKLKTDLPFAVHLPLIYPDIDPHIEIVIQEKVQIVFTSADNPAIWTSILKGEGIIVVHVIANSKFALKAMDADVDAIVAEGFEAGGHNGKEETPTLCLIPKIVESVNIPVIAAGGITSGKSILAAFALEAEGVQIESRFAGSKESLAHDAFKQNIIDAKEGATKQSLISMTPVCLLENQFVSQVFDAESRGFGKDERKTEYSKTI